MFRKNGRRTFISLKRRIVRVLSQIKQYVFFDENRVIYHGDSFKSFWEEYYGNDNRSFFPTIMLKHQTKSAFLKEGFRLDEFYLLGLEDKKKTERACFLSRNKEDAFLVSYYGTKCCEILRLLKDKYLFYTYLKDFFKRDAVLITNLEDRVSFLSFCERHHKVFAKPNKGSSGIGVKSFIIDNDEQAGRLFDDLVRSGEWIVEELINQDPAISAFNSSSINTVRFPSLHLKETVM